MFQKNKKKYFSFKKGDLFKRGDLLIYSFILSIFVFLISTILSMEVVLGGKAEIYVDGHLKYIYKLTEEENKFHVKTDIGGVTVLIKNKKIRILTSNSPQKLCVKQGWINTSGSSIIGIPDKLIIKVIGNNSEAEFDSFLR